MQSSTPIGIVAGLGLIFGAIFLGTAWQTFFDLPAALLVLGGTASALLVSFSFDEIQRLPPALEDFFYFESPDPQERVDRFADLARTARRDGLLALDRQLDTVDDELTRVGLELAVDGSDEDEIVEMLDRKSDQSTDTRRLLVEFFNQAGTYAPSFGMLGTLIGLIQMLQNLTDPSEIGEGMAMALLTTFYGALIANLIFLPIARQAQAQLDETYLMHRMAKTGILSIVRGERPSMVERRLEVFALGDEEDIEEVEAEPAEEPLSKAA